MQLQHQSKALSDTYTDADEQEKKQILRIIFPTTLLEQSGFGSLSASLKEHFSLSEHKALLINHAFKSHLLTSTVYRQFITQRLPQLSQPSISSFYSNQLFADMSELGSFRGNPKAYPKRNLALLEESVFEELDKIFHDYGYVPSLERYLTLFPRFLVKMRIVEEQLFQNTRIDQETTFFLGLCAAAQMGCPYMINRMAIKFLAKGGKIEWVKNKKYPAKIAVLLSFNRKLARSIWDLSSDNIEQITESPYWNTNQLAFIVQVLSFIHSMCIITLGLGLIPEEKNTLISTQKIQLHINHYRQAIIQTNQKQTKKPPLKQVLSLLKIIIQEMKNTPQIVQPKINPKRSFRKDTKNSEQQQTTTIETYMRQIGTELTEQRLVSQVLQQMNAFLPEYSQIDKRRDNKNNQITCVDFNFQFMAYPRLQSFGFVSESTKKILSLIKESEQMGYQNFGLEMVGSTKEFRRAQRYYAENLCGFKHPEYDYDKLQSSDWTGPTTWGISEAQTNYKNITNLNASNWILGNQTIDDYNKQLFDFITNNNVTKCPLEAPFLRGSDSSCIVCEDPTPVFDLQKKNCVSCPAGTQFNPETHKCEKVEGPQLTDKCTANYIWNDSQNKCTCPDSDPIDLGCECVKCLEPFVWNSVERACKLRCEETHIWNKETQKCECPKSTPYEVNGECIACNAPFEWNVNTNTCQLNVNNCIQQTVPTTPTLQTCTSNYVWDDNVQQCVCPLNLPFNDGTKCLQCDLPKYWDHNLKQCLYCPQNTFFNTLSRTCEACPEQRPLWKNYTCESCPSMTTFNKVTGSCDSAQAFIDPATTSKVPIYTTTPSDEVFIDPAATEKVPVYTTQTTK